MTDPIADLLTRIRNANRALLKEVEMPHSRLKENVARVLVQEGYLAGCQVTGEGRKTLHLTLKYTARRGAVTGLKRISKPGLRHYVGATEVPRVLAGLGVAVLSTSRGVMTGREARKANLGGEVLCHVW
ncbi:MAG: 30S ribosomal protein S8 [Verrucomicrobiales bacterium]|nr:30S ribosomal protein S8 [Verrucomicrobiales bacterium]MCP5528660.1 30S ribosomal protein S8 [Verrucomicrobiales bacterium]